MNVRDLLIEKLIDVGADGVMNRRAECSCSIFKIMQSNSEGCPRIYGCMPATINAHGKAQLLNKVPK